MDNQLLFQGPPGLAVPQLGGPAVATPTALSTPPQSLPAAVTAVTAPFAAAAGNPLQNPVTFNMVGPSGMPMTPNAAASLLTPLRPGTPGLGLPVMPPPINTTSAGECVCHISALQHHHVWECVCVMSLPFNTTSAGECVVSYLCPSTPPELVSVCVMSALQHLQWWWVCVWCLCPSAPPVVVSVCVMSLPFSTSSGGECVCHVSALQHLQWWWVCVWCLCPSAPPVVVSVCHVSALQHLQWWWVCVCHVSALQHLQWWWVCVCHVSALQHLQWWWVCVFHVSALQHHQCWWVCVMSLPFSTTTQDCARRQWSPQSHDL